MFAMPFDIDFESSRNVIPKQYLENRAVTICPRVAACLSKNWRTLQHRARSDDLSCDYDGVCGIRRLDVDSALFSVRSVHELTHHPAFCAMTRFAAIHFVRNVRLTSENWNET